MDKPAPDLQEGNDEPDVIIGSREQLLHLLAEAAEIEHTLMCSYLYAAFSLKRPGEGELSAEEGQAVARWRKTIMDVAIEEMGHLLMVANLTVAVGGRPHFARPNFPVSPGYFPSGVVVRLTPFSKETIEHFIFLERPKGAGGEDDVAFEEAEYSRDQANQRLMPGGQDYATIGHLYVAIRENLQSLEIRFGRAGLFLGADAGQVGPDVIDLEGVSQISDLSSAIGAIDLIVEQGEGSPADREISHYRKFLTIRDEFDALRENNGGFVPAWPAAESPVLRRPPDPEGKRWIDAPEAAAILDFGCAVYGVLLRFLIQSFGRRGPRAAGQRKRLVSTALALMHCLAEACDALVRLPASVGVSGVNAGMSFTMLRGVEPLLSGPTEERILREQLDEVARGGRALNLKSGPLLAELASSFRLDKSSATMH